MVPKNKSIYECEIEEIVDCINKQPYGKKAYELIRLTESFPRTTQFDWLRVACIPYLFHAFERGILNSKNNPVKLFNESLQSCINFIENQTEKNIQSVFSLIFEQKGFDNTQVLDVVEATGQHYGNLFKEFTLAQFKEAKKLLEIRLNRNNIDYSGLPTWKVLDQGCGGGRYSAAWKLLGADCVVGVDISEIALEDAHFKTTCAGIDGISWIKSSVLDMPFEDGSFDVVFSNGVLHHTTDVEKGVRELVRVLKKGGLGWLYLIESPGGIFWDKIEILRAICRKVDKEFARAVVSSFAVPKNRVFYMLDHVMVPINTRLTPLEVEEILKDAGAREIRRLKRGTDFDRIEQIHRNIPYSFEKFGVGENRYIFTK